MSNNQITSIKQIVEIQKQILDHVDIIIKDNEHKTQIITLLVNKFDNQKEQCQDSNNEKIIIQQQNMLEQFFAIIQTQDEQQIILESRMFNFGNLPGPLPLYEQRIELQKVQGVILNLNSATGSGKSILMPLIQLQQNKYQRIFVLQPSRMIVHNLVQMLNEIVTQQIASTLNNYNDQQNKICVCTYFELMEQLQKTNWIIGNSCFILDEYHIRTVEVDVVFAKLLKSKNQLLISGQLILMSATPDEHLKLYFKNNNMLLTSITLEDNKPYFVNKIVIKESEQNKAKVQLPVKIVKKVLQTMGKTLQLGNIMCFTSGKGECEQIIEELFRQNIDGYKFINALQDNKMDNLKNLYQSLKQKCLQNKVIVVPILCCGKASQLQKDFAIKPLPNDLQQKCIKIIIATNYAESSITIQDLVVVIDSGLQKEKTYDNNLDIGKLQEKCISQKSRDQRAGRVGRVCDGEVHQIQVDNVQCVSNLPEIQRIDIIMKFLNLKKININLYLLNDNLPQPVNQDQMQRTINNLIKYELLNQNQEITQKGKTICGYDFLSVSQALQIQQYLDTDETSQFYISLIIQTIINHDKDFLDDMQGCYIQKFYCKESDFVTLFLCYKDILRNITNKSEKEMNFIDQYDIQIKTIEFIQHQLIQMLTKLNQIDQNQTLNQVNTKILQIVDKFSPAEIFQKIDKYIKDVIFIQERMKPGSGKKYICQFDCLTQATQKPRQLYKKNDEYFNDLKSLSVACFERMGSSAPETFSNVYFGDILLNEQAKIYVGKYIHKFQDQQQPEPIQRICTIQKEDSSFVLTPYFNIFSNLLNQNQKIIEPMYVNKNNQTGQHNIVYFAATNKNTIVYQVNTTLNEQDIQQIKLLLDQIKKISIFNPYSIIVKNRQGQNIIYIQNQQQQIETQLFESKEKFAYKFSIETLRYLMNTFSAANIHQLHIGLVIGYQQNYKYDDIQDLFVNKCTQNDYHEYKCAFNVNNNHIVPQLIIVSEKLIEQLQQYSIAWDTNNLQQFNLLNDRKIQENYILEGNEKIKIEQRTEILLFAEAETEIFAFPATANPIQVLQHFPNLKQRRLPNFKLANNQVEPIENERRRKNGQMQIEINRSYYKRDLINQKQQMNTDFDQQVQQIQSTYTADCFLINEPIENIFLKLIELHFNTPNQENVLFSHFQMSQKIIFKYNEIKQNCQQIFNDNDVFVKSQNNYCTIRTKSEVNIDQLQNKYPQYHFFKCKLFCFYFPSKSQDIDQIVEQLGCFVSDPFYQNDQYVVCIRTEQAAIKFKQLVQESPEQSDNISQENLQINQQIQESYNNDFQNIKEQETNNQVENDKDTIINQKNIVFKNSNEKCEKNDNQIIQSLQQKVDLNFCTHQSQSRFSIVLSEHDSFKSELFCTKCILKGKCLLQQNILDINGKSGPLGLNYVSMALSSKELYTLLQKMFQQQQMTVKNQESDEKCCPYCQYLNQREEQCNAIVCKKCQKWWCFKCDEKFVNENAAKIHLTKVHNGWYDK